MSRTLPSMQELKALYGNQVNIMSHFRQLGGTDQNSLDAILISYDLQSGSYLEALQNPDYLQKHHQYTAALARVLGGLDGDTLLEAGVGEATTLCNTVAKLPRLPSAVYGFDLSWSRIAVAQPFVAGFGFTPQLSTGDLFNMPFADRSADIVFTSHAIEPNHGREREALAELYRVARKWVVLFEPSYELGSEATRQRIEANGYCRDLAGIARELGMDVVEHRLLEFSYVAHNQTGLVVIRKDVCEEPPATPGFGCPVCKQPLAMVRGNSFCEGCSLVFPVIDGIPCLLASNGVLASKYMVPQS